MLSPGTEKMANLREALSRYRWPIAVAAMALALYVLTRSRRLPVETAVIRRGPIEEYVTEEAETQLDVERVLTADRAGTMRRITLEVGDRVSKGQVVASVEDTELKLSVGAFQDQLEEIAARLEGADVPLPKKAEIETAEEEHRRALQQVEVAKENKAAAEADLDYADRDFERIKGLFESGSATDRQYQEVRRNLTVARALLSGLTQRLAAAETAVQIAALRKQVLLESMQDTAHLHQVYAAQQSRVRKMMELLVDEAEIESPIDGVVMEKYLDSEQFVQPGTPLLKIGDMDSIEVRADILSEEVGRVREGQRVVLVGKAIRHPGTTGHVKQVYPSGFTKISSLGVRQQRVSVLIDFDNSELRLGPGYEMDVKIVVEAKADAVLVPSAAVFATAEGTAAFVVHKGKARLRPVATGLKGEDDYEVVEGLQPGDVVILRPPTDLEDGRRVKPRTD